MPDFHLNPTFDVPSESEYDLIGSYIAEFALDGTAADRSQFIVARITRNLAAFTRTRVYDDFLEFCSLGVLPEYRHAGLGTALVREQIRRFGRHSVYIATVIPDYFTPFGFKPVDTYPSEMDAKIVRCGTLCHTERPTVMRLTHHRFPEAEDHPG